MTRTRSSCAEGRQKPTTVLNRRRPERTYPMIIPPPGLHAMCDADYFALPLPNASSTKRLIDGTNAHLAHSLENPEPGSDAMLLGSYLHAMVLAPQLLETDYIVHGSIDRRTRDGKAEWDAITKRANLTGATPIPASLAAQASAMATAIRSHVDCARLINILSDREITVIGDIAGRPAKAKLDGIIRLAGASIIVDLKTTSDASPLGFANAAARHHYYHQAAWYARLLEQHLPPVDDVLLLAVETNPPHLCSVYRVPATARAAADQRIDALAARWWLVAEGDRSGYPTGITNLDPPRWWIDAHERAST